MIPRIQALPRHVSAEVVPGALHDLRQGVQTVLQSPWLWITIAIAGLSNITLSGPFEASLPLLVKQHFNSSAQTYGLIMAFSSVGAFVAAIWLGWRKHLHRRGYLTYGAWIIAGLMIFSMGLSLSLVVMCVITCVWGASVTTLGLAWTSSLQDLVPPDRLGRVASIDALGSFALLPIGYGLAGIAADKFGAPVVFLLGGIISAGVIALGLLHPAIRAID